MRAPENRKGQALEIGLHDADGDADAASASLSTGANDKHFWFFSTPCPLPNFRRKWAWQKPVDPGDNIIIALAMPNCEIKFKGEGIRALSTLEFGGNVTVESRDGIETHVLWVKGARGVKPVRVAEYKKREGDVLDNGETFSYIVGCGKIGDGNLLAAVLLRLGQMELQRKGSER